MNNINIFKQKISNLLVWMYKFKNPEIRLYIRRGISFLDGHQYYSHNLREIMKYYHQVNIGIGTYGACFDPVKTTPNVVIGKYSSIAPNACLYTRNHPIWYASSHPLFFNSSLGTIDENRVDYSSKQVGNDVWIGEYAVILASCKRIGDGAVIGAGAVVAKDIPDYAIAVGNPAKVIKYRFSEEVITKFKTIKWWDWDIKFIKKHNHRFLDVQDLFDFCNEIDSDNKLKNERDGFYV